MTYLVVEDARRRSLRNWPWVPLRRLTHLRREVNLQRNETLLALSADFGIQARPDGGGRQLASASTEATYWVVHPNDLVFNPMWALEGGVAVSAVRGAVSPAYRVYEPTNALEPRFLHYYMRSRLALDQYRALARGVTTFDRSVTREDLDEMPVPVPPRIVQRTIADYLDAETTRIDALIVRKQRLISLLDERRRGTVDEAVAAGDEVPVRRLVSRLTSGPRGWAEYVSDAGDTSFIRITNIRRDDVELDRSDLVRVVSPQNAEAVRTMVRENDVLVSITADIGSVAIARVEDAGAAVSQHVALMTPEGCDPMWLAHSISSSFVRSQLEAGQYGGTKTQLSLGDVAAVKIRLAGVKEQERRLESLKGDLASLGGARRALRRQLDLLREHRQALITAAVTGELDVPGVA